MKVSPSTGISSLAPETCPYVLLIGDVLHTARVLLMNCHGSSGRQHPLVTWYFRGL